MVSLLTEVCSSSHNLVSEHFPLSEDERLGHRLAVTPACRDPLPGWATADVPPVSELRLFPVFPVDAVAQVRFSRGALLLSKLCGVQACPGVYPHSLPFYGPTAPCAMEAASY